MLTCVDLANQLLLTPFLVGFNSLSVAFELPLIIMFSLRFDHKLDGTVDDVRLGKHPLSNVLATVWALFAVDQTLRDANLTKRVTTDGGAAADNVVHADGAV